MNFFRTILIMMEMKLTTRNPQKRQPRVFGLQKAKKNGKFPSKKMNLTIKHTKSSQMRSTTIHPLTIIVKLQMRLNFSPEILIP